MGLLDVRERHRLHVELRERWVRPQARGGREELKSGYMCRHLLVHSREQSACCLLGRTLQASAFRIAVPDGQERGVNQQRYGNDGAQRGEIPRKRLSAAYAKHFLTFFFPQSSCFLDIAKNVAAIGNGESCLRFSKPGRTEACRIGRNELRLDHLVRASHNRA